jgi:hypothetical protein
VIWSDKCYVYIGDDKGTIWITWRVDEEYEEDCVIPKFKQSYFWVMICVCIMKGNKGPMVVLEYPGGLGGGMTVDWYQEQVLEKVLSDYCWQLSKERGPSNLPAGWSLLALRQIHICMACEKQVQTFPHPSSLPNLSPIEPLWHQLKTLIRQWPHPPTSFDELKEGV